MKKIFGGINLTWPKLIIMSIIAGIYTGVIAMIPLANDTSFSDLKVTFEVWIFFGIFIIMNSKSPKDSALKCFVFFLILDFGLFGQLLQFQWDLLAII